MPILTEAELNYRLDVASGRYSQPRAIALP